MKQTFIDELLERIPLGRETTMDAAVIFPTKRAGQYFKKAILSASGQETRWLPGIYSIRDYLHRYSRLAIAGEEELLPVLYKVHREVTGIQQSYTEFQKWGQMILKDFNEIDQYLIEPSLIFHYVEEYKKIDTTPILSEDQVQILDTFWNLLPEDTDSRLRKQFLKTWESLGKIYRSFQLALSERGVTYEGQAYRQLLSDLRDGSVRLSEGHLFICGFNALSIFEEELFKYLVEAHETKLYWDIPKSWLDSTDQFSAHFIQKYVSLFPEQANEFIDSQETHPQFELVEAPADVIQLDYAIDKIKDYRPEETAIVLCDESLAYPMILRQSEAFRPNMTMGFPVALSPAMAFFKHACDWFITRAVQHRMPADTFVKLIGSPWLQRLLDERQAEQLASATRKFGYMSTFLIHKHLGENSPLADRLLAETDIKHAILDLLRMVLTATASDQEDFPIIRGCVEMVNDLNHWLEAFELDVAMEEYPQLIRTRLLSLKIPFSGAQENQVQVMGFLESRGLDFKNLLILSADDKHLPGSVRNTSFIPHAIKRALKLPTYKEHDAIYSYHFYRLLLRAERVSLVYSTTSQGMEQVRSRFVEQIAFREHERTGQALPVNSLSRPIPASRPYQSMIIDKEHPVTLEKFDRYYNGASMFSASQLVTYLKCPVQYYLKHILKIDELEEISEDYDQRELGLLFHRCMELFYQPFMDSGEWIDADKLKARIKSTDFKALLAKAFIDEQFSKPYAQLKGQNLLVSNIIIELVRRVLDLDAQGPAFRVIGLEMKLSDIPITLSDGKVVHLRGVLDRVDEVRGERGDVSYTRIIDYKTGKVSIGSTWNKTPEEVVGQYFKDARNKEGFQLFCYAWMYRQMQPEAAIKAGIYGVKKLSDKLSLVNGKREIDAEMMGLFEGRLRKLLEEILDVSSPFVQSDDDQVYSYSSYRLLVDHI